MRFETSSGGFHRRFLSLLVAATTNGSSISDIGLSRWISARDFCNADELGCREAIKHVDELLGCFHTSWVWLNMVYGYWLIQIDCRLMEHEDNGPYSLGAGNKEL